MTKKVYVLFADIVSGCETVLGVYHTREKAEYEGYQQIYRFYVKEFDLTL